MDQLQPLNLSFNKPVKDFMRGKFQEWYANQVLQNYGDESDGCTSPRPVQFPMSQMKPLEPMAYRTTSAHVNLSRDH